MDVYHVLVGQEEKRDVLTHKLSKPELPKRKVSVVGPDDIVVGDVDPPDHSTCHRGCGRQLCYVGPEGKVNWDIGSRGLEREASMRASRTENQSPENFETERPQRISAIGCV